MVTESEVSLSEQPIPTPCICRKRGTLQRVNEESDGDEESIYELEELEVSGLPPSSQRPDDDSSADPIRLSSFRRKS